MCRILPRCHLSSNLLFPQLDDVVDEASDDEKAQDPDDLSKDSLFKVAKKKAPGKTGAASSGKSRSKKKDVS